MSRMETISREIFNQVRTTIVLNMRFMDMAVFRLSPVAAPVTLATDGQYLYFHPLWLIKRYRGEANAVTRDYLHVLMHCVFRHPFISTLVDERLWDLACDIAVEGLISELNQYHFATKSETRRSAVADSLRKVVKPLTAEKLYHYFQTHAPDPTWKELFHADDHELWHSPAKAQQMSRQAQSQNRRGDDQGQTGGGSNDRSQKDESSDDFSDVDENGSGGNAQDKGTQDQDSSRQDDGMGLDQRRFVPQSEQASDSDDNGKGQNAQDKGTQDQDSSRQDDGLGLGQQRFDPQPGQASDSDDNGKGQSAQDKGTQDQGSSGRDDGMGLGQRRFDPQSGQASDSDGNGKGQKAQDNGTQNQDSSGQGDGAGSGQQRFDPRPGQGSRVVESNPQFDASLRQALEDEWRDISEHVQMDLETFAKQKGLEAGGMQQMLAELNRERYDYAAFLKKFATMGEIMKINDDEFDYIFYTYGLKLFGNMPLIEPLEYKEVKRVREFVIAIDTSGSTSGELVHRFLTKTYNLLMSTESFFSKVNIYIIQCDAQIQEVVKISKRDDFEDYIKHMTIRGLGGTDFRPVFAYVDQLVKQHVFQRLKGMIYFTDGYGTFPERKPDYTTAFVFVQDQFNNLNVPPWAIRLILEKEEV